MSQNAVLFLIFFMAVDLILLFFILRWLRKRRNPRKPHALARRFRHAPPAPAVAEPGSAAYELAVKLEESFTAEWTTAVKQRVLSEHPYITEREYEWRWLELKRFFIMCAVMQQVPMFSSAVDEVWHEMLMYTREYQQFSDRFLGRMLHHAPHGVQSGPMPEERAWFDLVYVELFGWTIYSAVIWGAFFRNPLPLQELELYRYSVKAVDSQSRFNAWTYSRFAEARKAIDSVLDSLRFRIALADDRLTVDKERIDFRNTDLLLASAVYFSINDPDGFLNHMVPQENPNRKDGSGGASSSACGFGGTDSSHSHCSSARCGSGSSDSGSSSCSGSSDGGGSSCSGCGGGGD